MGIPHFYIFLLIIALAINRTSGDKVSSTDACKEASSMLEMVMFFPMSICGQEDVGSSESGTHWISSVTEYSQTFNTLLKTAKSKLLHTVEQTGFERFQFHLAQKSRELIMSNISNHITYIAEKLKRTLNVVKEIISESSTKIRNVTGRTVNNVTPYLYKISTPWQIIVAFLLWLSDVTMTFKACVMTVLDECLTTITCSPCLYARYALAGLLLLSLPFSFYKIVTENQEKRQRRKRDKISLSEDIENTKNGLRAEKNNSWSNLVNLGQIFYFSGFIFSSDEGQIDEEKDKILSMLHYRMCEIYDGYDCNCGGRTRPIGAWRGDHVTRFKLKPAHYPMCENFDNMACNCGGFLRKSPHPEQTPRRNYTDIATNTITLRKNTAEKEQQVNNPLAEEKMVLEMSINDGKHLVEQYEITNQELNSTSFLTEVSMMEEIENIENEIGHPKFNSSFIDNSPYASTLSDSAYSDRASGDGPMLVITRRSPRKECGMSFTEDESVSYLDSGTEQDDSLLDVSDINKSLSFNSGDGVYEFVIMYALQTIFRTTKRLFQTRRSKQLDESQTGIGDLSGDTYFVISRRKSRSRQSKQRLNTNQSATVKDNEEFEDDTNGSITDDSLTDYDRISDVSVYGDISERDIRDELDSWSISSKSECFSLSHSNCLDNMDDNVTNQAHEKEPDNNDMRHAVDGGNNFAHETIDDAIVRNQSSELFLKQTFKDG